MTGTQCHHLFHKNCAMVWLTRTKRPKDHCPYCRNEMLTAAEMKAAALQLLGEERVKELAHFPEQQQAINNNNNSNHPIEIPDLEHGVSREIYA
jgi:Anaphase-promoting complex subunit 11 RING-H2 finger